MTTASEASTTNPIATINTTAEPTMVECRPPANETETSDSPAQTQQYQVYQTILNFERFKQVCNLVSIF